MTTKRIVLIIMCAMLLLTVIMAAVVIGRVAPVLNALLNPQEGTVPTTPSTQATDPSTQPTSPTTEATDPSTQPTVPTTEATDPSTQTHKHEFTSLTQQVQATCSAGGYSIYTCSCGQTQMRDYVEPISHSYGPGRLIAPTCTEEGCTERTCTVCGNVDRQDVKEPTGHNYVEIETKEVTCEEDGYTVYQCMLCEKEIHDDLVKAVGHHSFGDWKVTTEPSAGKPGVQSRQCTACGKTEERACELEVIAVSKSEPSDCWNYIIKVGAKNAAGEDVAVYTYELYDYGRFNISIANFSYSSESGLILFFVDNSGRSHTYQLTTAQPFYINKDGEPGIPETVPPGGEETTAPTDGPTQATEPFGIGFGG